MMGLRRNEGNLMFLYAVYLAALAVGNVMDDRYMIFLGTTLPASVLAYPLTFLVLCVVGELWTREDAGRLVLLGLNVKFVGVVLLGLSQFLTLFPNDGARSGLWGILGTSFWEVSGQMVLGRSISFWTVSLISFPCAQFAAIAVFSAFFAGGAPRAGRWRRFLAASLAGEMVETAIFLSLVLAPDWGSVVRMGFSQMTARGALTLMELPAFYALTWRRRQGDGGRNQ